MQRWFLFRSNVSFEIIEIIFIYTIGGAKRKAEVDKTTYAANEGNGVAIDDDVDFAECEKLLKDVNSFDNNKAAVTIPDEVANRQIVPESAKKIRLEDMNSVELEEGDSLSGGVDLETMLSDFVDKPNQ